VNNRDDEQPFDPFALEPEARSRRSPAAGLAWLALLLALIAVAGSGYEWWREWRAGAAASAQQGTIDQQARDQDRLAQRVAAIETRLSEAQQDGTAERLEAQARELQALEGRLAQFEQAGLAQDQSRQAVQAALFDLEQGMGNVEKSLAALSARADGPGKRLDIHETESLLRTASERLQLFADPQAAELALALADQRLAALDDPLYLPVRQHIVRSRQALAAVRLPDPVELDGRLESLQERVSGLPFPGERVHEQSAPEPAGELGVWDRFRLMLSGLVTVRRAAPEDEDLLTLLDKDYLRQGLWLQLESARMAVMRRDARVYALALARAADIIGKRFDAADDSVAAALQEIRALGQLEITAEMPDISTPFSLLQDIRQRAGETVAPESPRGAPAEEPAEAQTESGLPDEQAEDAGG